MTWAVLGNQIKMFFRRFFPNVPLWLGITVLLILLTCWLPVWPCKSESIRIWLVFYALVMNPANCGGLWWIPFFYLLAGWTLHFFIVVFLERRRVSNSHT